MKLAILMAVLGLLIAVSACAAAGMTISDAKQSADNSSISLTGKVVTYATTDSFYIEEDNRSMGIMVRMTAHGLTVGMRADVVGTMKTKTNRERYILATSAVQTAAPNSTGTISPVGMNNYAIGGTDWNVIGTGGQKGTTSSIGLNNVGLLVNTWGAYQQVNATTFTVDDGAGLNIQCTVPTGTFLYSGWQYVAVTGISSMFTYNSSIYPPNLLVRDIVVCGGPGTMIYIPAGSFLMGNSGVGDDATYSESDEFPQHSVTLAGYYIGKFDVTRGEYAQFINAGGYSNPAYWSSDGWNWVVSNNATQPQQWAASQNWENWSFTQTDSYPVVGVTYYEAEAFCNWAGGHLPTEAQWEMAARWTGTHPNVYPWGDTWDAENCNNPYDHNSAGGGYEASQTSPVGSYPSGASPCGCMDMAGNVWEWCKDWYGSTYYSTSPSSDPQGPANGSYRVLRGGSWKNNVIYDRCACRNSDAGPGSCEWNYGFRLAR